MSKFVNDIDAALVRSLFSYDAEEGRLRWKLRADRDAGWNKRYAHKTAGTNAGGYWRIRVGKRFYFEHRLVWVFVYGVWPTDELDHVNCIGLDNRIGNLRDATNAENVRNVSIRRNNTSGYKGVRKTHGADTWSAEITFRRMKYNLGSFRTKEEAHAAYCAAAQAKHGEFANMGADNDGR